MAPKIVSDEKPSNRGYISPIRLSDAKEESHGFIRGSMSKLDTLAKSMNEIKNTDLQNCIAGIGKY